MWDLGLTNHCTFSAAERERTGICLMGLLEGLNKILCGENPLWKAKCYINGPHFKCSSPLPLNLLPQGIMMLLLLLGRIVTLKALSAHWEDRAMAQVQLFSFLCLQLALLMHHNTFSYWFWNLRIPTIPLQQLPSTVAVGMESRTDWSFPWSLYSLWP